jgi:putative SbcD/Mre11-related phosphoesterase
MSSHILKPLIPFPALAIENKSEKILVIADLHLGWEVDLATQGIHIPSQSSRTLRKLLRIIEEYNPDRLILLGDVKHAIPRISYEEWRSVPEFLETVQRHVCEVTVVLGNHDGDLEPLTPRSIQIVSSGGMVIGEDVSIGLFHGHAWPCPEALECESVVMGHIHPVWLFKDKLGLWIMRQIWLMTKLDKSSVAKAYLKHRNLKVTGNPVEAMKEKLKIEVKEMKLIVMPAFNDLVGGAPINRLDRNLIGPLLGSSSSVLNNSEVYLLDGTYIGAGKTIQASLAQ